jgi:predicted RNA-binding Zn ribbon-like protein
VAHERPPFSFDAGRVALDFLATLSDRHSVEPGERLPDPGSLEAWLRAAGLAAGPVAVGRDDLMGARRLREAVFGLVDAVMEEGPVASSVVRRVNAAARPALPAPHLVVRDGRLEGRAQPLDVTDALSVLARDAIELVTGPQASLLRECEAGDCSGIYVDASHGGRRRWCSTARCGNRARVAAHRARRRAAPPTGPPDA